MSEKNPWITSSSRVVYQNQWIRVREDQVIRPDGNPGIYGVIDGILATGIVAVNERNEIYLVGQYRYPLDKYSWEIPEGGAHSDETPLEGAKRELKEESGLVANSWFQLGEPIHTSNCVSSETAYLYLARDLELVESNPEVTEVLQVKKIPFNEALQMAVNGEISDAISIIGIFRAAEHFK